MHHVDKQAVPSQPIEPTGGGARKWLQRTIVFASEPRSCSDAEQNDAEPWEDWNVVLSRRLVGHHPDPVEPSRVEERQVYQQSNSDNRKTLNQRRNWIAHQWPRNQRRHGNAMQDAERYEALRKGEVASRRDQQRAQHDKRDAFPESVRADSRESGEHQTHSHQQQKGAHDDCSQAEPQCVVANIRAKHAEPTEIERKVIADHGEDRCTAQGVDRRDARGPLVMKAWRGLERRAVVPARGADRAFEPLAPAPLTHSSEPDQARRYPFAASGWPSRASAAAIARARSGASSLRGRTTSSTRAPCAERLMLPEMSTSPPAFPTLPLSALA